MFYVIFLLRFFPTYLDPKDHIQRDRFSISKLEKQNVLQYMFTEIIFFDNSQNFKYSHFNIFHYPSMLSERISIQLYLCCRTACCSSLYNNQ